MPETDSNCRNVRTSWVSSRARASWSGPGPAPRSVIDTTPDDDNEDLSKLDRGDTLKDEGGDGDGDDESIHVDLTKVPAQVKSIVFTISSFRGQTFEKVENAFCRVVDATTNVEIAKYNLSAKGNYTALIIAKVYRHNGAWKMSALGETCNGKTIQDMVPSILPIL